MLDNATQDVIADEIEEFITGERRHLEPDRVLATVLFTDIVGSTERAAELGDARWREMLSNYCAVLRKEVATFRGREVNTVGDGLLATFDGPARAIRWAIPRHIGGQDRNKAAPVFLLCSIIRPRWQ